MAGTFLFTGPSLKPAEATKLLQATVLPPIKRGDLREIEDSDPDVIAIIDGEFYQSLAVSPKEILPFLERGVRIYGASSIGALRATELEKFGMKGIGRVFRLFRRGLLNCDDEVALTYCPFTYEAKSEALVNTRFALRAAVREGLMSKSESCGITRRQKQAYFPERTRELLLSIAHETLGSYRAALLHTFLKARPVDVKEADARLLVKIIDGCARHKP